MRSRRLTHRHWRKLPPWLIACAAAVPFIFACIERTHP